MRIVFLGSGAFGVPSLRALGQSHHEIVLVVSQPDRQAGRKKEPTPAPLALEARRHGLPLFQPERINTREGRQRLADEGADVFVVVAYGQILKPAVLETPRLGCVNVHGSLLPRHRGASPVQAAILAGDRETGVTIMQMDEGLDSGPMLAVSRTTLGARETAGELHDRLAELAPPVLLRVLEELDSGRITPEAQDLALATFCSLVKKEDGRLRWQDSAADLDRRVRAMAPWPGAFGVLRLADGSERRLLVEQAEPLEQPGGEPGVILEAEGERLIVAAGQGSLRLLRVRAAGRESLPIGPFLRGCAVRAGDHMLSAPS